VSNKYCYWKNGEYFGRTKILKEFGACLPSFFQNTSVKEINPKFYFPDFLQERHSTTLFTAISQRGITQESM
jgi:hypothetical protein